MSLHPSFRRFVVGSTASIAVLGGALAALAATHPAAAAAALVVVQNTFGCATTTACVVGNNTSTGPGVAGVSKSGVGVSATGSGTGMVATGVIGAKGTGTTGYGVRGASNSNYGVFGQSTTGSAGVAGTTPSGYGVVGYTTNSSGGIGVYGYSSNGYGTYGTTATGNGYGVVGVANLGTGTYGGSTSSYALNGQTTTGYGLYANASGTGTGAYLSSASGYGLKIFANNDVAAYALNSNGNGADITGSYIGVIARAQLPTSGGNTYPIVGTDGTGNNLFFVDNLGDVSYHGGLFHFARVGGALVKQFSPNTTQPTLEDTGTAQLVGGAAVVRLDPTFAASMDAASSYRVFLTPGGDTRGLFVATKTPGGFMVRESQGGRSTVSFDYRIVATAAGQRGQRMAVASAASEPHAQAPNVPRLTSAPLAAAPHPAALAQP